MPFSKEKPNKNCKPSEYKREGKKAKKTKSTAATQQTKEADMDNQSLLSKRSVTKSNNSAIKKLKEETDLKHRKAVLELARSERFANDLLDLVGSISRTSVYFIPEVQKWRLKSRVVDRLHNLQRKFQSYPLARIGLST